MPQKDESEKEPEPLPEQAAIPSRRVVPSEELFHGEREVWIQHDGTHYRLRITRRNKLILQK